MLLYETLPLFKKYNNFILESGVERFSNIKLKELSLKEIDNIGTVVITNEGIKVNEVKGVKIEVFTEKEGSNNLREKLKNDRKISQKENRISELGYELAKYLIKIEIIESPSKSIRVINMADETKGIHLIVETAENVNASIIEEHYGKNGNNLLNVVINEIYVGKNANLSYTFINNINENSFILSQRKGFISNGAKLSMIEMHCGGRLDNNIFDAYLNGRDAFIENISFVLAKNNQRYNLTNNLHHVKGNTRSYASIKSVLLDKSKVVQKGIIKIYPNAKNSYGYLSEHAILFDDSWNDAIPSLEIDTNDVKATHSSYATKISEEQIFYLMSRGLTRQEAIKLIIYGFYHNLLYRIKDPLIKALVRIILEERYSNNRFIYPHEIQSILEEYIYEEKHEEEKEIDLFERHYKYR